MSASRAQCDSCGEFFRCLGTHWGKKPQCRPSTAPLPAQVLGGMQEDESVQDRHFQNVLRARAAEVLQHLRYDKYASESLIDELKPAFSSVRRLELDVLRCKLLPLIRPGTEKQLDDVLAAVADPFYGLRTSKRERDYAVEVQKLPVIEPRVRNLRQPGSKIDYKDVKNHGSVGFSIVNTLARLMQNDSDICEQIIVASDEWKTGSLHEVRAAQFFDITDGENFRNHKISRKADESEINTVRVGLQLYNDGVTMTNPIGFGKSENKYECCYAAIANLPPRLRFNMDAIQLLELTNSKAFKAYGAVRILGGRDAAGNAVENDNFAADMRRLDEGVEISNLMRLSPG